MSKPKYTSPYNSRDEYLEAVGNIYDLPDDEDYSSHGDTEVSKRENDQKDAHPIDGNKTGITRVQITATIITAALVVVVILLTALVVGIQILGTPIKPFTGSSEDAIQMFDKPAPPAIKNHAELCEKEVVNNIESSLDPRLTVVSDEKLPELDETHKVVVNAETSFTKAGQNDVFQCVIGRTGEIITLKIIEGDELEIIVDNSRGVDQKPLTFDNNKRINDALNENIKVESEIQKKVDERKEVDGFEQFGPLKEK